MTPFKKIFQQEDLNFLFTNRVPRMLLTRLMGCFSQIRSPWLARASIAVWRCFADLDLSDAKKQKFDSLHECFIRELKEGSRPLDMAPEVLTSPVDAIVGQCGQMQGTSLFQAKGFPYAIEDLFGPSQDTTPFHDGIYVTLRLTSAMYHRFHAPHDCEIDHVTYLSGDTWNVNPIALKRDERLFCRNERAVLRTRLTLGDYPIALVPVAAILVASIRLHFLDALLHMRWRGANEMSCRARFSKGQEMGWFQHGSTVIVFAPKGFALNAGIEDGTRVRMGQPLMTVPSP